MDDAPNAQQMTPFLYPPGYEGSPKSGSQVSEKEALRTGLNPSINAADSFESEQRPELSIDQSRENSVDNGTTLDTSQSTSKSPRTKFGGTFGQKRVEDVQSAADTSVDSTQVQAHLNKSSNSKYSEEFRPAVDADVYRQGSDVSDYMENRRKKSETQRQVKEATEKCMKMIEKNQVNSLRKFLKDKLPEDVKVSDLVDLDGFTLLHMAVFKNKTPIVKELIKIVKEDIQQYEVAEWVRMKTTKDQFTALHYASFRGNIDLLDLLLANGADMEARNLFGLNVLHIAAQGDQPISIFYFKQKKMDLCSTDKRGSTPLHWACFQNSEIALIFILGWVKQSKMSLQDIDGFTPLHLAIKSSEQIKSGRPMRALLMKGANRDARDKKGRRPADLIDDIKDENLQGELRQGLQDGGKCDCLMLRTQMKKTEKSLQMPMAFLLFYDSTFAILMLFLFPVWEEEWQVYLNLMLGMITMTFWFISQFSDPGFIKRPRQVDFLKLMQIVDPIQLCPDCLIVRTPRSRHCNTCNMCVERYDHHCPWINNCVGVNNHQYFIIFLSSLWVSNVLVFISSIVGLFYLYELPKLKKNELFYDFLPEAFALEKWVYEMASLFVIVLTGFFILPIGFLFYIQVRNFITNKTTNERFSRKKPARRHREPNELRMDSTGSSLVSTTSSMIVEDIINDVGDPEDYYAGGCVGCHNCTKMFCSKPFPSQLEMYNKFISQREALHKQVSGLDISEEAGSGGSQHKKKSDPAKPKRSKSYGT